jgi:hypothetical protein
MQELWLFGNLDPISKEEAKKKGRDLEALASQVIAVSSQKFFQQTEKSS